MAHVNHATESCRPARGCFHLHCCAAVSQPIQAKNPTQKLNTATCCPADVVRRTFFDYYPFVNVGNVTVITTELMGKAVPI